VRESSLQGCESVRKTDLNARFVMIVPPSIADLVSLHLMLRFHSNVWQEKRLRGRGTETEETLAARLGAAEREMEYGGIDVDVARVF
jgi:guanylate kinase